MLFLQAVSLPKQVSQSIEENKAQMTALDKIPYHTLYVLSPTQYAAISKRLA